MPTTLSRSLLTVLIPGLVASAPWLLALVQHTSATLGFSEYPTLGHVLIFATAAVTGAIFEGLGSVLEDRWDKEREDEYSVSDNWYEYLARSFDREPVAYRYISRMVTSLYFELSMLFAIPVFIVGSSLLTVLRFEHLMGPTVVLAIVAIAAATYYLWWQARCTHLVLCKTRKEINERFRAEQF